MSHIMFIEYVKYQNINKVNYDETLTNKIEYLNKM